MKPGFDEEETMPADAGYRSSALLGPLDANTLTTPPLPGKAARERVEVLLGRHPVIARATERYLVALLREDARIGATVTGPATRPR
ncbi:hypothetical protein F0A16_15180 [Salinicola corii]|uniref:Uncharacterized protein n=1 Tax=Salinicola corii TaxID=2606937 RepID=A0A640WDE7_9GAMM|nr:hypothetical protein [Salinicola corii]KAA0016841.1 hypothetical protein F0A16_15180 [Salinicola corii]